MRVLILGGTGFFGKSIFQFLSANKLEFDVTFSGRSAHRPRFLNDANRRITYEKCDMLLPQDLHLALEYDVIIHSATYTIQKNDVTPYGLVSEVLKSTHNLLNILKSSAQLKKLVYISSGSVYGRDISPMLFVSEDCPVGSQTLMSDGYTQAKILCEKLCNIFASDIGVPLLTLRPFSFSGRDIPHGSHFAIRQFVDACLSGEDITINGHPNTVRSYLDQSDLGEWLWRMATSSQSGVFNVGSPRAVTISELASIVRMVSGRQCRIVYSSSSFNARATRYVPDVTSAREVFGLTEKISLEASLASMMK